jgi:hypothetical protein
MTDEKTAFEWFCIGFAHAGEGYNGEYPFSWNKKKIAESVYGNFLDYYEGRVDSPFHKNQNFDIKELGG